jgi:cell division septation protein DedD
MKKSLLLSLLLICSICAQDRHEFSLSLGGGLSTLMYKPTVCSQHNGLDAQFGFGYAFFFSKRVGLATGLELAFYDAEYKLGHLEMRYMALDVEEKTDFEFRSKLSSYQEDQSAAMLQIPLMLQLQTGGYRKQYLMMGVKAAIPLSGTYNGKGDVINSGYYEEEDYEYTEQAFRGFGQFKGKKNEGNYNFKASILASMELGAKWKLQDGLHIYAGAYLDYGLGNILEKQKVEELPQVIEYNSLDPPNYAMNGIFKSQLKRPSSSEAFTSKIIPLAIGLKLRMSLGLGVNEFEKLEQAKIDSAEELARLEAERLKKEQEQEANRLAEAEKMLQEARMTFEKAQHDNDALRMASSEIARLAAEKAQLESEIARLATAPAEIPEAPPATTQTTAPSGEFAVQVGVMLEEAKAQQMVNSLKQSGFNAYYKKVNNPGKLTGIYYRVRVGYFDDQTAAVNFARSKLAPYYGDWWVDRTANDTRGYTY